MLVPRGGLEPPRPCGLRILSPLRLPISPSGHGSALSYFTLHKTMQARYRFFFLNAALATGFFAAGFACAAPLAGFAVAVFAFAAFAGAALAGLFAGAFFATGFAAFVAGFFAGALAGAIGFAGVLTTAAVLTGAACFAGAFEASPAFTAAAGFAVDAAGLAGIVDFFASGFAAADSAFPEGSALSLTGFAGTLDADFGALGSAADFFAGALVRGVSSSSSSSSASTSSDSSAASSSIRPPPSPMSNSSSSPPMSSRSSSPSGDLLRLFLIVEFAFLDLASAPRFARGRLTVTCGGGAGGECGSRKARISSGVVNLPSINSRKIA